MTMIHQQLKQELDEKKFAFVDTFVALGSLGL
jgi:hypothetical protein